MRPPPQLPERPRLEGTPLENMFDRLLSPFQAFVHHQTTGGLVLMAAAVAALLLANSPWAAGYQDLWHTPVTIGGGPWVLALSLHGWVNEGLMALFFLMVGLEIKRELLVGELSAPRQAALPIVAAVGGMVVPALIYAGINPGGAEARGWGVPMATDIAFAVGALVLLRHRVPAALSIFLVALAIVDDLGAVLVIALFYTAQLDLRAALVAAALFLLLVMLNRLGVRRLAPYFIVAALLWLALLKSGIHSTIAGVLMAFTVPARARYDSTRFSDYLRALLGRYDRSVQADRNPLRNEELRALIDTIGEGVKKVQPPAARLESALHAPVTLLIVPLFAFVNAGIPLGLADLSEAAQSRVSWGVALGLVLGKFIGIGGAAYLAVRVNLAQLPHGVRMPHIFGAALFGGIGFTMAIFIAELAFKGHAEMLVAAKTGILVASALAGLLGYIWLRWLGRGARVE